MHGSRHTLLDPGAQIGRPVTHPGTQSPIRDGKGLDEAGKSRIGEMTPGKTMQPVDQPQREDLHPMADQRVKRGRKDLTKTRAAE
jgi:hypothetical protein